MLRLTLKTLIRNATLFNINQARICKLPQLNTRSFHQINVLRHSVKTSEVPLPKVQSNDEEYVLTRVQNDPDVFGPNPIKEEDVCEEDLKEEKYVLHERPIGRKKSSKDYGDIIKSLIRKKKIKEAVDVVEVKMIQKDKVQPENYHYNLLLGACGTAGYTKKAFSLFNDMKKRGLTVHPGAYTALFNACANSPWPTTDGLSRAKHLHQQMIEKRYEPNLMNYHAMIKAYGRGGDLNLAFSVVDEIVSNKMKIKTETINMLLQACITDKEAGFRHALLVWQKLRARKIKPNVFAYNLMLRTVRDCGIGDLEATRDVIQQILPPNDKFLQVAAPPEELIPSGKFELESVVGDQIVRTENRPDLLSWKPHMGNIVELSEIKKPEDRLLLLGGLQNIIANMKEDDCIPDNKTFTLLLESIPSTQSAENELLKIMKKSDVKPDLDFYNMLIKKRAMRFDYDSSKEVLSLIFKARYLPNLITYGVLALSCRNKNEATVVLNEMTEAKYRINIEILGAMLKQACCQRDFPYVLFIMEKIVEENISPNQRIMDCLTEFYKSNKAISNDASNPKSKSKSFIKGYQIFRLRFKTWKEQVQWEKDTHPWEQYQQEVKTDVRHYKDKALESRFKPIHKSKFRQKSAEGEIVKDFVPKRKFKRKPSPKTKVINE